MIKQNKKDTFYLCSVIGSLAVDQFNNNQDEYRKVINTIFNEFYKFSENDWKKYYVNICPMCEKD